MNEEFGVEMACASKIKFRLSGFVLHVQKSFSSENLRIKCAPLPSLLILETKPPTRIHIRPTNSPGFYYVYTSLLYLQLCILLFLKF